MSKGTYRGVLSVEETLALSSGQIAAKRAEGFIPAIAGGERRPGEVRAATYDDPIVYPLPAPTVSGTTVTVDFLLNNPTRVNRIIADLVMRNFFLNQIFTTGGDVQGGAVLYDQPTEYDVYTDRDVEEVEPGNEFPILTGQRVAPLVAQVKKLGGKFFITAEARRRNIISRFTNQTRRVANTITRKMNQRGIAELAAVIAANSRTSETISWGEALEQTALTATPATRPLISFASAQKANEDNELGYSYDTAIMNPAEMLTLRAVYERDLDAALRDVGITRVIVTPRKAADSVYVLASGSVGEMRLEEPLRTVTEEEGFPERREVTWVQSAINPVMYVTDPFAILSMTGTE